jgi:predicted RNA-binding protein (virulence factor B family)
MVNIGKTNRLQVIKAVEFGVYLDAGDLGQILLPTRDVPVGCEINDWIEVFVYRDSEDLLIATTQSPLVMVGQCAYLKVKDVNKVGAFLDWGLSKDLFVPFAEQQYPMKPGQSYVVYVYLDEHTQRITASSKLHKYLDETSTAFAVNDAVDVLICGQTELGYKAVINNTHLGLFYKNELAEPLRPGQQFRAYIKDIRADHKIDLKLHLPSQVTRDALSTRILEFIADQGGQSTLTDKSTPEQIYKQFAVSKSSYKKALGKLYKQRLILIDKDKISLAASKKNSVR